MRPLAKTDHSRGHISVLSVLTSAPEVSETQYTQTFDAMRSFNNYFTLVIISRATDTIVGAGTVFIEQKFIRNLGTVGHIEDIVVDKSMQGRKLGLRLLNALTGISEARGCYKTILNCNSDNVGRSQFLLSPLFSGMPLLMDFSGFYQKCGYEEKEIEMVKYQISTTPAASVTTSDSSVQSTQAPRL